MLCLLVIIFVWLLVVVQRRSAREVWEAVGGRGEGRALDPVIEDGQGSDHTNVGSQTNNHANREESANDDSHAIAHASNSTSDTERLINPTNSTSGAQQIRKPKVPKGKQRQGTSSERFFALVDHHSPKDPNDDRGFEDIELRPATSHRVSMNKQRVREL